MKMWLWAFSALLLSACAAFRQTPREVTIREPGKRRLGAPQPIVDEAKKHWQFASLAEAAYRRTPSASASAGANAACPPADVVLKDHGWERWKDFPDDGLLEKIQMSHLRVEVWENRETKSLVVSFGGTVFKSGKDWKSNLRWFLPRHKDEYTEIVSVFGPAFVAEFKKRAAAPEGAYLRDVTLYATGHSLGGGLAQQFAYALPLNDIGLHVKHVYAFDPSPVTGYFSVDIKTRRANKTGLAIDRIYERGEVLALVRSITSFFWKPSASDPAIRAVRYALFYTANPIAGHSIENLACQLRIAAGQ